MKKKTPAYLALYEELKKGIVSGVFPRDSRFPSKRVLSDRYAVSLVTVEHSLSLLVDEGYLLSKERSGCFVRYHSGDFFDGGEGPHSAASPENATHPFPVLSFETDDSVIAAASAPRPSEFPASSYVKTMRRVLSQYDGRIFDRVPPEGSPILRKAIADYLRRSRGISVTEDRILLGAGSEYLYSLLVKLLGSDHRFAIEKPSYYKIESVYRANGLDPELLSLGPDGILSNELKRSTASVLHITPYRSYPTGISVNASKKYEYLAFAKERCGFIIEDDYESEFSPSSKPFETLFSLSDNDSVLYMNSFSQTLAPGIRIAYLILPERLVPVYRERFRFLSCTVPTFDQLVLADYLNSGDFERHLNRVRRKLRTLSP